MKSLLPLGQEKSWQVFLQSVKDKRLGHAQLILGPAGIGKLWFANAMAAYLNCDNPSQDSFCGVCSNCSKILKGIHADVHYALPIVNKTIASKAVTTDDYIPIFREHFFKNPYLSLNQWIEAMDGGDNKQAGIHISEIRELKRKLTLRAFEGKNKVAILWFVEKMNVEAANTFLKLLEEPPDNTYLFLCCSEAEHILPTIQSRCQTTKLARISEAIIQKYLIDEQHVESQQAFEIAHMAEGSITAALEMISDSSKSFSEIFQQWAVICYEGDLQKIAKFGDDISKETREFQKLFLNFSIQKFRDMMMFQLQLDSFAIATEQEKPFLKKFARFIELHGIDDLVKQVEVTYYHLVRNANAGMAFISLTIKINGILRHTIHQLDSK